MFSLEFNAGNRHTITLQVEAMAKDFINAISLRGNRPLIGATYSNAAAAVIDRTQIDSEYFINK